MELRIRDLKLRNKKECDCGHEFSNADIKPPIVKNTDYRFYGGRIEYYTKTQCPKCKKEIYLFLEAYDNKYLVIDTAEEKCTNKTTKIEGNKYICDKCRKEFKNKRGLTAHKRKCQ